MGLTAEAVAKEYNVSREEQDQFAYNSHQKALMLLAEGKFKDEIVPVNITEIYVDENGKKQKPRFYG